MSTVTSGNVSPLTIWLLPSLRGSNDTHSALASTVRPPATPMEIGPSLNLHDLNSFSGIPSLATQQLQPPSINEVIGLVFPLKTHIMNIGSPSGMGLTSVFSLLFNISSLKKSRHSFSSIGLLILPTCNFPLSFSEILSRGVLDILSLSVLDLPLQGRLTGSFVYIPIIL